MRGFPLSSINVQRETGFAHIHALGPVTAPFLELRRQRDRPWSLTAALLFSVLVELVQ